MSKSFAITGLGGCGTAFLAREMNKSKQWTVLHEPRPSRNFMEAKDCGHRFKQSYYGEVNPFLRFLTYQIKELGVEKIGVIWREPKDVLTTWKKRSSRYTERELDLHLKYGVLLLEDLEKQGYVDRVISFDFMIRNKEYLHSILYSFGITDVPIDQLSLEPENSSVL